MRDGDLVVVRLADGEDFFEGLKQALKAEGVHAGVILGAVGMLKEPVIGFYRGGGRYESLPIKGEVEICALAGNVAVVEGDIFLHLHVTMGTSTGQALAGHMMGGKVHMTSEIAVHILHKPMSRKPDDKTGLKTLRFE
jgi:predicted DNA-binding protein with PD1-like motif